MSEMKIGEIMAFKCVEAKDEHNRCDGCMFCDDEDFCWSDEDISGHCSIAFREDKKDVIFVSTDPNEIIRERIEKSIDGLSGGNDCEMIALQSNTGECKIGFKAGYWKRLLSEILQVDVGMEKEMLKDEVQSNLQDS